MKKIQGILLVIACFFAFTPQVSAQNPLLGQLENQNDQITSLNLSLSALVGDCDAAGEVCEVKRASLEQVSGSMASLTDNMRSISHAIGDSRLNREVNRLHAQINSLNGKLASLYQAAPNSNRFFAAISQIQREVALIQNDSDCIRVEIQSIRNGR